jgi:hypothetical protein
MRALTRKTTVSCRKFMEFPSKPASPTLNSGAATGCVTAALILALLFTSVWHLLMAIRIASTDFKDGMLIENPVMQVVLKQGCFAADGNPKF